MPSNDANADSTSIKLDTVLAKMDDLLKSRDLQETKLNSILEKLSSLESYQEKTAADVNALKDNYSALDAQMSEVSNELALKATREELASIHKKMEDLENRSKRNNIVLWGLKGSVEATHNSFESFLKIGYHGGSRPLLRFNTKDTRASRLKRLIEMESNAKKELETVVRRREQRENEEKPKMNEDIKLKEDELQKEREKLQLELSTTLNKWTHEEGLLASHMILRFHNI